MRRAPLLALAGLLLVPAGALANEGTPNGTDNTMVIMLGLIVFLMVALVVIGILEQRKPH